MTTNNDIEIYSRQFKNSQLLIGQKIKEILFYLELSDNNYTEQPNNYGKSLLNGIDIKTETEIFSIGNRFTNLGYGLSIDKESTLNLEYFDQDKTPIKYPAKITDKIITQVKIYWKSIPFEGMTGLYPQEIEILTEILVDSIFKKGDCLTYIIENGKYGGAFVLTDEQNTEVGANFIAITKICQTIKPTLENFKNAEIVVRRQQNTYFENLKPFFKWDEKPIIGVFMAKIFKKENVDIEIVRKLKIYRNYKPEKSFAGYGWNQLLKIIPNLDEYEKINGVPKSKMKLSKWTNWHCL